MRSTLRLAAVAAACLAAQAHAQSTVTIVSHPLATMPQYTKVDVPLLRDELPVFWACGVTPQAVVATVKPEFCITHYPGCMLVTDRKNAELAVM